MSALVIVAIAGSLCLAAVMIVLGQEREREQMRQVAREWSVRQQRRG